MCYFNLKLSIFCNCKLEMANWLVISNKPYFRVWHWKNSCRHLSRVSKIHKKTNRYCPMYAHSYALQKPDRNLNKLKKAFLLTQRPKKMIEFCYETINRVQEAALSLIGDNIAFKWTELFWRKHNLKPCKCG